MRRRESGFTLVELVVVVAIIAILAAIAMVSYRKYTLSSNRQIGIDCIIEAQRRIDDYYSHLNDYPTSLSDDALRYGTAAPTCGDAQVYVLSYAQIKSGGNAVGYSITGTGQNGQQADGTLKLTFDPSSSSDRANQTTKQRLPAGSSTWESW